MLLPEMDKPVDFFLFSDMLLYPATHIYFIGEKATLIILSYIIVNEATDYKDSLWMFFWLMVADLVDYMLIYNEVWFYVHNFPVSMNVIKSVVFGLMITRELWKQHTS